jgi:hypothetical protein
VEIVTIEVCDPLIDVGLKVAVAPVGSPEALKETVGVNPFKGVTLAV